MNRSFRSAALLTAGLVAACGDAPTEPAALRVAEHARVVLEVPVALPSLADAEALGAREFARVMDDLQVWLDAAETRLVAEAAPEVDLARLAEGREALRAAAALEQAGERAGAVVLLAQAQTRLLEATARAFTALEIDAAGRADVRCAAESGDVVIRRGRRLLAHAREAAAEGDYERAVQRAYYAEMLLARACPGATPGEGAER